MRVSPLHDLAIQLQHQTQHTVRGRMLRAEVHHVVLDLDLSHDQDASLLFSSPGRMYFAPSHGLMKSNRRNSCVRVTGS